eukprot:gene8000-8198_t
MQQQDEVEAGVSDHKQSLEEHSHRQSAKQPDYARERRGDRNEQRDRAGGEKDSRGGSSGRRGKDRWGYSEYQREEEDAAAAGSDKQQAAEPVRKGRGFAGRRSSRSPDRDRHRSSRDDRNSRREGFRDSDRPWSRPYSDRDRDRGMDYQDRGRADPDSYDRYNDRRGGGDRGRPRRAGGAYIPPFRLARMMAEIDDKNSAAAQKLSWEALRKSLNGLINKVNAPNMKDILPELFQENLMRGRGVFCQAIMKAQLASPVFSSLYAALVSVVNTKFPELGELLLHRVIAQFKRAYKRNDKPICIAAAKFLAHLINQGVLHEVVALEILILLLENPSDDSVEMAVDFCKEVGAHLQDVAPAGLHSVFERLRAILHEGAIDKRCQYMIEGLFAVRKLDLVEDEDQITHEMSLDDKHDPQAILNVFREDPEYEAHEQQYKAIVKELLGEDDEGDEGAAGEGSEEEDEDDEDEDGGGEGGGGDGDIDDATGTNLVNLRRTIYLTIMSSLDFEEAGHKLMKIQLAPGQEGEIPIMIIECCSQEKTFVRYYALLGARFCLMRREYQTNKLRNVAKLFAHLLAHDAISWGVLGCIRLTEDDTTSSSRIFIKYLFQEYYSGIFPIDSMANMRFSINFFTSIGLGGITDRQRELYKQAAGAQVPNADGTVNSPVGVLMASLMAEAARSGVTAAPTPWPAPESALASAWSLLSPNASLPEPGLLVTPHYGLCRATGAALAGGSRGVIAGGQAATGTGAASLKRARSGQKDIPDSKRQQAGDQQHEQVIKMAEAPGAAAKSEQAGRLQQAGGRLKRSYSGLFSDGGRCAEVCSAAQGKLETFSYARTF